ncbi:MAG: Lytic transglycosylase catalytic subunit [Marmoricola sp.]|nr:Lytic transglycosylase catalytic subunit [Marmoricola sp.]
MSIADVTARIQQIQSQLALLAPPPSSGSDFSSSLVSASATATGTTSGGDAVVADARQYLGVPYVWGGTDPKTGLDCSGLVQRVYSDLGYTLPRTAAEQATAGTEVPGGLANAQPGDLLTFGSPAHHIGIYIGGGQMIDAPHPGTSVRVESVYETPSHVRRITPDQATSAAASTPSDARVSTSTPYATLFSAAAAKYDVPATLLSAVAKEESGYNASAVSPAGAEGLMQLMPATAKGLGVTNPFDPAQAVDGAARMLRDLTNRFGSTSLAVAAYNAGPGAVLKYGGIPPYPETQQYVRNVLAQMQEAS